MILMWTRRPRILCVGNESIGSRIDYLNRLNGLRDRTRRLATRCARRPSMSQASALDAIGGMGCQRENDAVKYAWV